MSIWENRIWGQSSLPTDRSRDTGGFGTVPTFPIINALQRTSQYFNRMAAARNFKFGGRIEYREPYLTKII